MKRKKDFTKRSDVKHNSLNLRGAMYFVLKSVLLALAVLMLGLLVSSCSRSPSTVAIEAQADVVEETFDYNGVKELQVEGIFFTVEVSGHSGDKVEGRISIPQNLYDGNYVEVAHAKRGGLLEVEVIRKKASIPPVSGKAVISIRAPRDVTLNIMTSSGKIAVEGFETDTVRLASSSGKITVNDINARMEITSSSGSQDIHQCKGSLTVESTSGRILLRGIIGNASAASSSGSQTYEEIDGNIKAESSSGRQSYEDINGDITSQSSSGTITITNQRGTLNLRTTSGKLEGNGVKLTGNSSFKTSSGRISFEFENDLSDFSFELKSSSGMLRVGESKVRGTLLMGNRPIKIKGKSSSGSQEYR